MTDTPAKLVICLVGTDHHPFNRLVEWCDNLATEHPDVEVLVQFGSSPAPAVASAQAFLGKDELVSTLSRAHVAISHGGPGLISEIRAAGLHPLVVPRDPERGEHVDGHQMRFVARIAQSGIIASLRCEDELRAAVSAQLAAPRGVGLDPAEDAARVNDSVSRFSALVDSVLAPRR